jgi:hypothetical protein
MSATHTVHSTTTAAPALYVAFELGWTTWKVASTIGAGQPPRIRTVPARCTSFVVSEIKKAKLRFGLPADTPVVRAVELRAAQQMLMQFARLKSSQPIEEFGTSVIDRPTLARHHHCVLVRESQVRRSSAAGAWDYGGRRTVPAVRQGAGCARVVADPGGPVRFGIRPEELRLFYLNLQFPEVPVSSAVVACASCGLVWAELDAATLPQKLHDLGNEDVRRRLSLTEGE